MRILTEQGFIVTFIEKVFDAVVRQKNKALRKAMEKDPEFKQIVRNLEKSKIELEAWVREKTKNNPKAQQDIEDLRRFLR